MASVLAFDEVEKRFGGRARPALARTRFRLGSGELLTVHGGNGAGKSTLVRLAGGFLRPSSGTVTRTTDEFGFVPDRVAPIARLSALAYLRRLAGMTREPRSAFSASVAIAEVLDVQPGLDVPMTLLSRGNLRKVVLAQALMRPAQLVLMDEPLAGLDAAATSGLVTLVAERLHAGGAFVVATHHPAFDGLGGAIELGGDTVVASEATVRHTVVLARPLPGVDSARPDPDGVAYDVDDAELQGFLRAALDADCPILRLTSSDRDAGR